MVHRRERLKSDHLKLTIDIFDKRYRIGDFSGQVLNDVSALKHIKPASSYLSQHQSHRVPADKTHPKVSVAAVCVHLLTCRCCRTMLLRKSVVNISGSTKPTRGTGLNWSTIMTTS